MENLIIISLVCNFFSFMQFIYLEKNLKNLKRNKMEQGKNFYEELKQYFETTHREKVLEDWAKTAECDKVGPTVEEFLENTSRQENVEVISPMNDLLQDLKETKVSVKDSIDIIEDEFIRNQINIFVQRTLDSVIYRIETELLQKEYKWKSERSCSEEGFKILEVYNSISTEKRKPDNEFGIGSFPQGYDTSVWYCTKVVRTSDNQLFVKDFTETNKGKVISFKFYGDFENKKCIVITALGDYKLSEIQLAERMFSEEEFLQFSEWISSEDWVYLQKCYWVNEEQEGLEQKLTTEELFEIFKNRKK